MRDDFARFFMLRCFGEDFGRAWVLGATRPVDPKPHPGVAVPADWLPHVAHVNTARGT